MTIHDDKETVFGLNAKAFDRFYDESPFNNLDSDICEEVIALLAKRCKDELDASAHLATCLILLCPRLEYALDLCTFIKGYHEAFLKENEAKIEESKTSGEVEALFPDGEGETIH